MTTRRIPTNPTEYREAVETLRRYFPALGNPHLAAFTFNVNREGTARNVAVFAIGEHRNITNVSANVARVLGWPYDTTTDSVRHTGGGVTPAVHIAGSLARRLYDADLTDTPAPLSDEDREAVEAWKASTGRADVGAMFHVDSL